MTGIIGFKMGRTLFHWFHYRRALLNSLTLFLLTATFVPPPSSSALDGVPTDEEIKRYRKSSNPLSHGPVFLQAVNTQPNGPLSIREFLFSHIGESTSAIALTFRPTAKTDPLISTKCRTPSILPAVFLRVLTFSTLGKK